jgi:hypothetical protein
MEVIIGIICLIIFVKIFIKLLPAIWFSFLFLIALGVLLLWVGVLESTHFGIVSAIGGAVIGAWKFAKKSRNKG